MNHTPSPISLSPPPPRAKAKSDATRTLARAHLRRHEGVLPFPYLDSRGLVTLGVGFLLPDVKAFCAVPFVVCLAEGTRTANPQEKLDAWEALQSASARAQADGKAPRAASFRDATPLRVPSNWIDERLDAAIEVRLTVCAQTLGASWFKLTPAQRVVILDVLYANGDLLKFPNLLRAAQGMNPTQMAANSLYFSGRHKAGRFADLPRRNWARCLANYALCLDLDPDSHQAAAGIMRCFQGTAEEKSIPPWLLKRAENEQARDKGIC